MTTLQAGGLIPFLIFVAFAVIASFFEKRAKKEKAREQNPLPGQLRHKTWEEELSELLKQQAPSAPPMRREAPLPPSTYVPQPVRVPPPVYVPEQDDEARGIEVYLPPPQPNIEPVFQPMHGLTESDAGYARASELQQRVAQHMAGVTRRHVGSTQVERHEISMRTREAVDLVRNSQALRHAILASVILAPPRSLESL